MSNLMANSIKNFMVLGKSRKVKKWISRFCKKHATAFVLSLKKLQGVTKTFWPHLKLSNQDLNIPYNFHPMSPLLPIPPYSQGAK